MKNRIFSLCALLLCAFLPAAVSGCDAHTHSFRQTVIPPTCNSIGYTVNTCACGETFYSDHQPETEHTFGDWVAEQEATWIAGGEEHRICEVCGVLQTRDTENRSGLPKLYLDGAAAEGEPVSLHYSAGEDTQLFCSALLTQRADKNGGKHVYALRLLPDGESPLPDLGWGEQERYLLSPQTLDPTYTRTITAEALWNACLALHMGEDTPEWETAALENHTRTNVSAVIQVYLNGNYCGLYLLTLPQEAMSGSTDAALRAEDESDGCLFRAEPSYTDARTEGETGGFALLACAEANVTWATESFSAFEEFVRRSRDTVFREQLSQYTDPEILMEYYLLLQFFGAPNGDTVGTVWHTADLDHWLPSFSDYQASFGLRADGSPLDGAEEIATPDEEGVVSYGGQNLLWERLIQLFPEELADRYDALRRTVLQPDALQEAFLAQYASVEPELFEEEALLSPPDEAAADPERVRTFLNDRLDVMDNWIEALVPHMEDN